MHVVLRVAAIALIFPLACSPTGPAESTGDATSTGGDSSTGAAPTTGDASTSTGDEPPASTGTTGTTGTTGDPTTGAATTLDATTGDPTTTAASTSSSGSETGGASETTDASETTGASETTAGLEPVTRAWWVDGNELQIRVIQEDAATGLCRGVFLGLADVVPDTYAAVDTPRAWAVRYVFVHDGPGACLDPYMWYENEPAHADAAVGTVVFHDLGVDGKPATLDLDVTATHGPGEPWTPPTDTLVASSVPVEVG